MKKYILTESQIRNLVSGFVDEAKGDTKYTPEYLEKIKEKYKGKLLRDFEKGEDGAVLKHVSNKGKDYYLDFTKDMVRTKRPNYTDDELRDIAKKYKGKLYNDFLNNENKAHQAIVRRGKDFFNDLTKDMVRVLHLNYTKDELRHIAKKFKTKVEFKEKGKGASTAALRFGPFITNPITGEKKNTYEFYDSITSHMSVPKDASKRLVYVHEFYNENHEPVAAYVGLTYNSKKRKQEHITGINHRGHEELTSVTKFIRENPTYSHKYKELTDYIEPNESVKMEKYWEQKYFENGWKILNISPTGSLGSLRKQSFKVLKDKVDYIYNVEGVKELRVFTKKYPNLYRTIVDRGLHNPDNENYLLGKFIKRRKTDDELIDIAKEYDTYSNFSKNINLYGNIYRRKLLPKVKELFAKREQEQQNEPVE